MVHRDSPPTPLRVPLFTALLTPPLFTAYFLLVGDPYLPEPLGPYHGEPRLWALYIVPLAALGAVIPVARSELPVTTVLAVLALVGLPFYSPGAIDGSLFAVNFPALFALVVLLFAGSEWVLRNPVRARRVFTPAPSESRSPSVSATRSSRTASGRSGSASNSQDAALFRTASPSGCSSAPHSSAPHRRSSTPDTDY